MKAIQRNNQVRTKVSVGLKRILLVAAIMTGSFACGGESENGSSAEGLFCSYEQRTTRCSGSGYTDWEQKCSAIDFELREGLSPSQYCQSFNGNSTVSGGGCSMTIQRRDTFLRSGGCYSY